jgi:hypothetical protein
MSTRVLQSFAVRRVLVFNSMDNASAVLGVCRCSKRPCSLAVKSKLNLVTFDNISDKGSKDVSGCSVKSIRGTADIW